MIHIKRIEYSYAELDCTIEEWECLRAMVKWAYENYDRTVLDYIIPAEAENRMSKLESLYRIFVDVRDLQPPDAFHYSNLHLLLMVVSEIDLHGYGIERVDPKVLDSVTKKIGNLSARTIFPDLPWDMWRY